MFICPQCNKEVEDPDLVRLPRPWWQRRRLMPRRKVPVCPAGHKLRTLIGQNTELSLGIAFLLGLRNGLLILTAGVLEDARCVHAPHLGTATMAAFLFLYGGIAFGQAWTWAGVTGPVHRLTSRACGVALGYLVPAVTAAHALYFHWLNAVEGSCQRILVQLMSHYLPNR